MKTALLFFSFLLFYSSHGQTNYRDTTSKERITYIDTCKKIDEGAVANLVIQQRHSNPLIIANDIIISGNDWDSINTELLKDILVLKCPEAFNKYGYIGYNGVILIRTSQEFETTSPYLIGLEKFGVNKAKLIYALNGDLLKDNNIKISKASIKEIEIINPGKQKGINKNLDQFTCINIWTLTENERIPTSTMCRGLRILPQKKE